MNIVTIFLSFLVIISDCFVFFYISQRSNVSAAYAMWKKRCYNALLFRAGGIYDT